MKNLFLDKNTKIVVIGFGRFGQLLTSILLKHSKASIIVISKKRIDLSHKRLMQGNLESIKDADIVFPCVPISQFESVITKVAKHLQKHTVVIDVCSVKTLPVMIMQKTLPESSQIIASHPMFGPDSYRIQKKLDGLTLVLWNVSAKKNIYQQTKKFLKHLKLTIVELSPKEHDKYMAWSLGYSYLIGKMGQRMGIQQTPIDTYDFKLLLEQTEIVKSDSDELFFDMQTKNPFAHEVLENLHATLKKLSREIKQTE